MSKTFKTEGVVLRSLKYSETSLILDIYTFNHGLGSYIVSGVRKAKSKSANVYHPMNIIELVAYHPGESLSRIKEASYAYKFQKLDVDVFKSCLGTFFVDLLRNSIKEKEANQELYAYIGFQLASDFSAERPYFDLLAGEFTDNDVRHSYILNAAVSEALYHAIVQTPGMKLNKDDRRLVLDALMKYYRLHIEEFKELRSLPVLRAILS